jgi:hypothetical protein
VIVVKSDPDEGDIEYEYYINDDTNVQLGIKFGAGIT